MTTRQIPTLRRAIMARSDRGHNNPTASPSASTCGAGRVGSNRNAKQILNCDAFKNSPPPRQTVKSERFAEPLRPEVRHTSYQPIRLKAPDREALVQPPLRQANTRLQHLKHSPPPRKWDSITLRRFAAHRLSTHNNHHHNNNNKEGQHTARQHCQFQMQVCNNQPAIHVKIITESHVGKDNKNGVTNR